MSRACVSAARWRGAEAVKGADSLSDLARKVGSHWNVKPATARSFIYVEKIQNELFRMIGNHP